ncbi:hypothetical protein [Halorubrum amylolyticum]|uniref:hypothetical protein n=1 Tax=Halorubrum amylolyticum TaxID=2508724 RepID=UPI001008A7C0|nr:hypothetical protein [Halorubrum amylolyticum]
MPSKRAFAKRLAALAATGLGIGGPIGALTTEPPPGATRSAEAVGPSGTDRGGSGDAESTSGGADPASDGPRSAVADGTYDPTAAASSPVDTVVTGRIDPAVLAATGLPGGAGGRLRRLLDRYESASLGAVRRATGGAALTADGPEGCAAAVGDIDAAALVAELDADPEVARESDDASEFALFRGRSLGSAVAVAPDELVVAYGPTASAAAAHRDAGVDGERRRAGSAANYGPLPSLLGGDATVCVDLGPDARGHLRRALGDAPEALRTAVDASGAVGASLRATDGGSAAADGDGDADGDGHEGDDRDGDGKGGTDQPSVALRYGAVADPRRLDRETAEAIARAAREGETSLSEATVVRHGRTVIVDAAADGDLFASHASLLGTAVGDPIEVTDA